MNNRNMLKAVIAIECMIKDQHKKLHSCPECGMRYADKAWAEKCEAWCKEHHTCHLEIIQHAVDSEVEKA